MNLGKLQSSLSSRSSLVSLNFKNGLESILFVSFVCGLEAHTNISLKFWNYLTDLIEVLS